MLFCCHVLYFGPVWFLATLCQAKVWLPQFSWYVFGFCHTLASNILFSVWPICHRFIVVANFCQSLASYFFATLFVATTLLWLAILCLGKMWPGTKQALHAWKDNITSTYHCMCHFVVACYRGPSFVPEDFYYLLFYVPSRLSGIVGRYYFMHERIFITCYFTCRLVDGGYIYS
jgi:hypothetical protein